MKRPVLALAAIAVVALATLTLPPTPTLAASNEACAVTLDHIVYHPTTITENTTANQVTWFVVNNSGSNINVTAGTPTGSGNVSNLTNAQASFTIPSGIGTTDIDMFFDAGAANLHNSVQANLSASCGSIILPATFKILP